MRDESVYLIMADWTSVVPLLWRRLLVLSTGTTINMRKCDHGIACYIEMTEFGILQCNSLVALLIGEDIVRNY